MPTIEYSTVDIAPAEAFAYWNEAVCKVFLQLDCERAGPAHPFRGRLRDKPLTRLKFSEVEADAQIVNRTARLIRRASEDYCLVSVQLDGTGRIVQDGRTAVLTPGSFALYDSTRPYQLQFGDRFRQLVLRLDRGLLQQRLGRTVPYTARCVAGTGLGATVLRFLTDLAREADAVEQGVADRVEGAVADLLAAALLAAAGSQPPRTLSQAALLARAKAFIDARLTDPELAPATVAAALGVSPRYLNRLFEQEQISLARYMWQRRLDRAAQMLASPCSSGMTVGEIAYAVGFSCQAHFSRAFTARFGESPRRYRQIARP